MNLFYYYFLKTERAFLRVINLVNWITSIVFQTMLVVVTLVILFFVFRTNQTVDAFISTWQHYSDQKIDIKHEPFDLKIIKKNGHYRVILVTNSLVVTHQDYVLKFQDVYVNVNIIKLFTGDIIPSLYVDTLDLNIKNTHSNHIIFDVSVLNILNEVVKFNFNTFIKKLNIKYNNLKQVKLAVPLLIKNEIRKRSSSVFSVLFDDNKLRLECLSNSKLLDKSLRLNCFVNFDKFDIQMLRQKHLSFYNNTLSIPEYIDGNVNLDFTAVNNQGLVKIDYHSLVSNLIVQNGSYSTLNGEVNYRSIKLDSNVDFKSNIINVVGVVNLEDNIVLTANLLFNTLTKQTSISGGATGVRLDFVKKKWPVNFLPEVLEFLNNSLMLTEGLSVDFTYKKAKDKMPHFNIRVYTNKVLLMLNDIFKDYLILKNGIININQNHTNILFNTGNVGGVKLDNIFVDIHHAKPQLDIKLNVSSLSNNLNSIFKKNVEYKPLLSLLEKSIFTGKLLLSIPLDNVEYNGIDLKLNADIANVGSELFNGNINNIELIKPQHSSLLLFEASLNNFATLSDSSVNVKGSKITGAVSYLSDKLILVPYINLNANDNIINLKFDIDNSEIKNMNILFDNDIGKFRIMQSDETLNFIGSYLDLEEIYKMIKWLELDKINAVNSNFLQKRKYSLIFSLDKLKLFHDVNIQNIFMEGILIDAKPQFLLLSSDVINFYYKDRIYTQKDKYNIYLEIPNLTTLLHGFKINDIKAGHLLIRGLYGKKHVSWFKTLLNKFRHKEKELTIISSLSLNYLSFKNKDSYTFKDVYGSLIFTPSNNKLELLQVKLSNSLHAFLLNGMIDLRTFSIDANVDYTLSSLDKLKDAFVVGDVINLTSLYNDRGLFSVRYNVTGNLLNPSVKFNSANVLLLKIPSVNK